MVYVYALCDVFYNSFYIQGVKEVFGKFEFNTSKFPNFIQGVFAIIIENDNHITKLIIDPKDEITCNQKALEWCNIYGKVNYCKEGITTDFENKIKPIGPSFGVRIWNFPETIFNSLNNYFISKHQISNKREFFANYWRQYQRLSLSKYRPEQSSNNYVYFIGSLWNNELATNQNRANFIKSCTKNQLIDFHGGFAPRKDKNNLGFDGLINNKIISLKQYLKNTKKSAVVFNTPAVLNCHGWKLGEFLALGKAILSTCHVNDLPADLENFTHLIYINEDNLTTSINAILTDSDLKNKLENNARQYFESFLAPAQVIKRLLKYEIKK